MSKKEKFNAEATLEALKKYRERDPNFEEAIRKVVEAEVKYGKDDPAEGKIVMTKRKGPKQG